jgi:hypothetical protein
MAIRVSIGHTQALNGREAGLQAAHHALNRLGSGAPAFSLVISSQQYQAREVASGVSSLLGDTPMIGFSSPAGLQQVVFIPPRSSYCWQATRVETHWMPGYAQAPVKPVPNLKFAADQKMHTPFSFTGFNGC